VAYYTLQKSVSSYWLIGVLFGCFDSFVEGVADAIGVFGLFRGPMTPFSVPGSKK
jgi:hypothetical protein